MGRNANPAQMAKLNQQMAKMIDPRVLQQMGMFPNWLNFLTVCSLYLVLLCRWNGCSTKFDAASPIRNSGDAPWNGRREKMTSTQNAICSLKMTEFLLRVLLLVRVREQTKRERNSSKCS